MTNNPLADRIYTQEEGVALSPIVGMIRKRQKRDESLTIQLLFWRRQKVFVGF